MVTCRIFKLISTIRLVSKKAFKLQMRYGADTVSMLIRPFISLLPIIFLSSYLADYSVSNFEEITGTDNYKLYIIISTLLLAYVTNSVISVSTSIVNELQQGTFDSIMLSSTSSYLYWMTEMIFNMVIQLIITVIFVVIALPIFKVKLTISNNWCLLYVIFISFIANLSIGIFLSGITIKSKLTKLTFMVVSVITFLSGELYPITMFPYALRILAYINPLTYLIDITRYSILNSVTYFNIQTELLLLTVLCATGLFLSIYKYNKIIEQLKHNGKLSVY